jgi:hypothetical protein
LELAALRQQLHTVKKQALTAMDQIRKSLESERAAIEKVREALEPRDSAIAEVSRATKRENFMLELMTDASEDMAGMSSYHIPLFSFYSTFEAYDMSALLVGSFLDTAAEEQRVNSRVNVLLGLSKKNNIDFWAGEDRARQIVRFQDRAAQVQKLQDFFGSTLAMIYNAMFPQNPQPTNITELMAKFKDVDSIHGFVKAQMVAGAKFALIWLKICHWKLDFSKLLDIFYRKISRKTITVDELNELASPVAEKMIDELLLYDADFFKDLRYDDSTKQIHASRRT